MSPLTEPTKLTLAKTYVGIDDPDAADYITAVEAADEAASPGVGALETATKVAIHSFVKGCKADGIWPAIKASCILAGARTLEGALVPLAGTAPNKFGTAANWNYNRKTGLQGDGSTNYLDSGRSNSADPQNNKHLAVYRSSSSSSAPACDMGSIPMTGSSSLLYTGSGVFNRINANAGSLAAANPLYFWGASRVSSVLTQYRVNGSSGTDTTAVEAPSAYDIAVFSRATGGAAPYQPSDARLAFYSIGEALDLALLDTRVSDLITAFGAAIP